MTFGLLIGIAFICMVVLRLTPEISPIEAFTVNNLAECSAFFCAVSPNHHGPPGSYSPPGRSRMRQTS